MRLPKTSCLFLSLSLFAATGCVTPFGCDPTNQCSSGCQANGPILFGRSGAGCGDCEGCGELYVDPWINERADCCDPCDACGNHNGQSCGKCRSVFSGIESLWGYRCGDDTECSGAGSCGGSCGNACDGRGGCEACGGGQTYLSEVPTPAGEVIMMDDSGGYRGGNSTESYQPTRQRKIFQPKQHVAGRSTRSYQ